MRLPSGLRIHNPERIMLGYLKSIYHRYDSQASRLDDALSLEDLRVSRRLVSRLSDAEASEILALSDVTRASLAVIPSDVDLLNVRPDDGIPGTAGISRIVNAMCAIRGVKLAKTMKILHRKRPNLLPIFDSVVDGLYWPSLKQTMRHSSWGDYTIALMRLFHRDMLSVQNHLRELRLVAVRTGMALSHCRILDLLIWSVRMELDGYFSGRADELPCTVSRCRCA